MEISTLFMMAECFMRASGIKPSPWVSLASWTSSACPTSSSIGRITTCRLAQRVDIANWWGRKLKGNCFGFSTHANASPGHNARGFQVHTTEGPTQADPLATLLWNNVNELLGKPGLIHMRKSDWLDGDVDYEDPFYILRRTTMPFVLIEWLFFDNLADAKLLMDPHIQAMMRQALVTTIYQYSTK
jgi:N-acetylmuramoyl-L-alanine amidase